MKSWTRFGKGRDRFNCQFEIGPLLGVHRDLDNIHLYDIVPFPGGASSRDLIPMEKVFFYYKLMPIP